MYNNIEYTNLFTGFVGQLSKATEYYKINYNQLGRYPKYAKYPKCLYATPYTS